MMKDTPPTLTLEATTFNKPQLQEQLSVLEQRQEAQIALAGRSNVGKSLVPLRYDPVFERR